MTRIETLASELAAAKREVTRIKRELVLAKRDPPGKKCVTCNTPIPREYPNGQRIPPSEYARRKYCSRTCVGRRRRESSPARKCAYCRSVIPRVAPNGRRRSPADYAARTYCSRSCALKARYAKTTRDRMLSALRDYDGLPLTYDDLVDLTGTTRQNAQSIATSLVRDGLVERYQFDGQTLLRSVELQEAA